MNAPSRLRRVGDVPDPFLLSGFPAGRFASMKAACNSDPPSSVRPAAIRLPRPCRSMPASSFTTAPVAASGSSPGRAIAACSAPGAPCHVRRCSRTARAPAVAEASVSRICRASRRGRRARSSPAVNKVPSQKGRRRSRRPSGENRSEIQKATPCPRMPQQPRASFRFWGVKNRFRMAEHCVRGLHATGVASARRKFGRCRELEPCVHFCTKARNRIACSRVMHGPGSKSVIGVHHRVG